jgi:hypothetical protein
MTAGRDDDEETVSRSHDDDVGCIVFVSRRVLKNKTKNSEVTGMNPKKTTFFFFGVSSNNSLLSR